MRSSDDLFRLIKSLSKSEKRYFSLQTSLHGGEKNYLELFEAIDRMEIYDEARLKKRFEGRAFTRQFNVAKRYLHDLILRHLRAYHTGYSATMRVKEALHSAEILHKKGLTDQGRKMAARAAKIAEEAGLALPLVMARRWPWRHERDHFASEEEIVGRFEPLMAALDGIGVEIELRRLLRKMELHATSDYPRAPEVFEKLEELMRHPVMERPLDELPLPARVLRGMIASRYHYMRSDYEEASSLTERMLEEMAAHPAAMADNLAEYTMGVHNRLLLLRVSGRFDAWRREIERARELAHALAREKKLKHRRPLASLFASIHNNLLCSIVMAGTFEEGPPVIAEVEAWLAANEAEAGEGKKLTLLHNIAQIWFGLGEYRHALACTNRVVDHGEPALGKQIHYHARLFSLIVHYELGNDDLLPYLVRSTYRYYRSQRIMYEFEEMILQFFRRLTRISTRPELIAAFAELRDALDARKERPDMSHMLGYFHYLEWLESKVTGRDFVDVVRATAPAM